MHHLSASRSPFHALVESLLLLVSLFLSFSSGFQAVLSKTNLAGCEIEKSTQQLGSSSSSLSPSYKDATMLAAFYRRTTGDGELEVEKELWHDCKVVSTENACPSGKSLLWRVQVPSTLGDSYKVPGQFVKLRLNPAGEPLFLAMCSAPSKENIFDFLVKTTPNIAWLPSVSSGTSVQVSKVLGDGFCLDDFSRSDTNIQNVLLVAAGSGIAPLKACIVSGRLNIGEGRSCKVYYGEWTMEDICYPTLYEEWAKQGVEVIPCLSRETSSKGRLGRVQIALEKDLTSSSINDAALLCGMDEMVVSVRNLLRGADMLEERILTNL